VERQLWSIEGNSQRLDGGAMFGNAPKALWERWATPDERNRIELACRALLVRDDDRWILFETGIGAFFEPQLKDRFGVEEPNHVLLESLAEVGLTDADINVVVLSHLHFDHAGGLLAAWEEGREPRLLFPNARYIVSARAWDRANRPHPRDKASFIPELQPLLYASNRLEVVVGPSSPTLGPEFRLHHSDGHTPGLLCTEIPGKSGPVLFASDLIPGRAWVHTSITMGYDRFPEKLIDEKRTIMDELAARNGRVFFTHDPNTAIAYLTKDEHGRFGTIMPKASLVGQPA
jgi:glyoxylase-like metal-dependent hydrolase (beta-lactamase superfamily II)